MNEIRELIDTELEAVSGGSLFDVGVNVQISIQINAPVQIAVAVGGTGDLRPRWRRFGVERRWPIQTSVSTTRKMQ